MVTEDDLQAAYERAVALAGTQEGREAMAEYWGLAEARRDQCAEARKVTGPVEVPEDALTEALRRLDREDAMARVVRELVVAEVLAPASDDGGVRVYDFSPRLYELPVRFSPEGLAC
jgi:hypothetical protein